MLARLTLICALLLVVATRATAAPDPRIANATTELRKLFADLDATIAEGKWGNSSWEQSVARAINRVELHAKMIERTWPNENLKTVWEGVDRRKQQVAARGGNATGGDQVAAMRAYYEEKAALVARAPAEVAAAHMLPSVSGGVVEPSTTITILQGLDYPALKQRMAEDKGKSPKYFFALSNRMQTPAKGQEAKKGSEIGVTTDGEEKINKAINAILRWRDKMETGQRECAKAVSMTIAQGDATTHSADVKIAHYEMAALMARSFTSMFPDNPMFADVQKEAERAVDRGMQSLAHLFTGPFHRQHVNQIVLFKKPQQPGKENAADVVTEITPGQPVYAIAYFRQTVKEIGATKNDKDLGYSVATLPKFFVKESTDPKGSSSSVALYDVGGKDQPALKLAYVAIDLLPDPETTYKSHLQYLPSLHFAKWLLSQTPGAHDLVIGVDDQGLDDKFSATAKVRVNLDPAAKEALKAYYEKLWAKKLSTVVFPDLYGAVDKQADIPNRSELAKYGRLVKLSYAQTGTVMKPWPNEKQVNNYVGSGYGLFELQNGSYEIIALSFSRLPSEKKFRWTGLDVTPSDYTLSGEGGLQIRPTLVNFGYEIPKANITKSASWKQ